MRGRALILGTVIGALSGSAVAGDRLAQVRERGYLTCGVEADRPGFSVQVDGVWAGFDVDICRAVAAVILGDSAAADIVALEPADRFTGLQRGEVDLLARGTVWTLSRDAELGLSVPAATFLDRPVLVTSDADPAALDGETVCLADGAWPGGRLLAHWAAQGQTVSVLQREGAAGALAGLDDGSCTAAAFPVSSLAGAPETAGASVATVLDQPVWPLGPAIRQDDPELADIVRWTLHALVAAEVRGADQAVAAASAADPAVMAPGLASLLFEDRPTGEMLGVSESWVTDALAAVGHYGELYDRHFGPQSDQPLPRGPNAAVAAGGLLLVPGFY